MSCIFTTNMATPIATRSRTAVEKEQGIKMVGAMYGQKTKPHLNSKCIVAKGIVGHAGSHCSTESGIMSVLCLQ